MDQLLADAAVQADQDPRDCDFAHALQVRRAAGVRAGAPRCVVQEFV
jgi:hypothetical protein